MLFDNLGPYHVARLRAAAGVCDLLAVEFRRVSREYAWGETAERPFRSVTLDRGAGTFRQRLEQELERFRPEAVLVPGWGTKEALTALRWCLKWKVPAVVMSESTSWDEARSAWRERIKGRIVRLYSAALVGGRAHREYLMQLGFPAERIETGYDAVDNGYFQRETDRIRSRGQAKAPYFLASARFLRRKNLDGLLKAYALYVNSTKREPWKLVILGDGAERRRLEALAGELAPEDRRWPQLLHAGGWATAAPSKMGDGEAVNSESGRRNSETKDQGGAGVRFEGFRQYGELPGYYAGAGAFVHPAHEEPWGLVVNEAMASGLPVLVSRRCGCAGDLVAEGENGFLLDLRDVGEMAGKLRQVAEMGREERERMGRRSREIVEGYGPEQFAGGMEKAVEAGIRHGNGRKGVMERLLLKGLTRR